MRFKYGLRKLNDKINIISFVKNLGNYDDIKFLIIFIKQHNMNGNRVLVLVKD